MSTQKHMVLFTGLRMYRKKKQWLVVAMLSPWLVSAMVATSNHVAFLITAIAQHPVENFYLILFQKRKGRMSSTLPNALLK